MSQPCFFRSLAPVVLSLAILGFGGRGRCPAAEPKPEAKSLEGRGYIVPVQTVQLGTEVGGQVVEVLVEEGQRVRKGELLVRLDATRYEIDLKRRQALLERARARFEGLKAGSRPEEVRQAEADLRKAEAEHQQHRTESDRLRKLRQTGTVSAEEATQADNRLRLAEVQIEKVRAALQLLQTGPRKEQLAAALADIAVAEADLEEARHRLGHTRIAAPIDGTVLKQNVTPGSIVNAGAFPFGSFLLEIADLGRLEVDVPISERDIAGVAVGQACEVRTEAFPNQVFKGQVARVLPVLDRARGCFLVRVRLEVPADDKLRPEMSAQVRFAPHR